MKKKPSLPAPLTLPTLPKSPTGITGLDEITGGGLPRGRSTLVYGSAGCGTTILAMGSLVRGATQFGEPGVFMMFEENARELTDNMHPLVFAPDKLVAKKKVVLDHVRIEIEEGGEDGRHAAVLQPAEKPPTLIKKLTLPLRRFIGDMSHTEKILLGRDLRETGTKPE